MVLIVPAVDDYIATAISSNSLDFNIFITLYAIDYIVIERINFRFKFLNYTTHYTRLALLLYINFNLGNFTLF